MGRSPSPDVPDEAYFVVRGRRWRATDPSIPEALRVELVAELMAARRLVDRRRVHDAKVALGERGPKWWESSSTDGDEQRLAATIRALVRHRGTGATICPSDAARAAGGARWRSLMGTAREVTRRLASEGAVEIVQRGEVVDPAGSWKGPIRLRLRAPADGDAGPAG